MARLLVELRLKLLAAGMSTPGRKAGALLAAFLAGVLTAVATLGAIISGVAPDASSVVVVVAAVMWLSWVVLPLLAPLLGAGLDEALDPAAMALFPLRGREIVPGLLAAGLVGPAAWATAIVVVGLSASHVRSVTGAFAAVAAAALLLVVCVGSGRATVTAISRRAGSRRRRDATFAAMILLLAAGALTAGPLLLTRSGSLADVAAVLSWSPGGQLGLALRDVRIDEIGSALVHLAVGFGFVVVLLLAWERGLDRALAGAGSDGSGPRTRSGMERVVRRLPVADPRVAAVAAKELILTFRDPIRRSTWLVAWTVGIASPLYLAVGGGSVGPAELTLAAALPAFIAVGGVNLNAFGLDGGALWTQISSSASLGPDLRGRAVAMMVLNLPLTVLAAVVFAAVGGDIAVAPLGVAAGVGVSLAVLGAGAVLSVRVPTPRAGSALGVSPGMSGRNLLISAAAVLASLAGLAPGVVPLAAGLSGWSPGLYLGAPLLVVCGSGICVVGLRMATRWADARQPELLAAVTRGA